MTTFDILFYIFSFNPKTKSDFARMYATEIGELASRGFITTLGVGGNGTNRWHITKKGAEFIL